MKLLKEFFQKPNWMKLMLFEAMWLSLYYKAVIKFGKFEKYAAKMGTFKHETPKVELDDKTIEDVRWVIYAVKRWTPWKHLCFDQALMAKRLLNKRGLPCTLYMGLCRNSKGELKAHAWLRCGVRWVSGGDGDMYTVTGIYGDEE